MIDGLVGMTERHAHHARELQLIAASLVLKNGSKTWSRIASDMPVPVSLTASITRAPGTTSKLACA